MKFSFEVPASFLISGEYFVTLDGGLGLAMAARPTVRVSIRRRHNSSKEIICLTRMGFHQHERHNLADKQLFSPLLQAVRETWEREIGSLSKVSYAAEIILDSSQFFAQDGRKLGFGSSAAVCAGLCTALAHIHPAGMRLTRLRLAQVAITAHRRFQGGRGSGYDVMTAIMGGAGIFRGGRRPDWTALPGLRDSLSRRAEANWIINAPEAVSTPSSISGFSAFRSAKPELCQQLFERSQALHADIRPDSFTRISPEFLQAAAQIGIEIGEAIEVPAAVPAQVLERLRLARVAARAGGTRRGNLPGAASAASGSRRGSLPGPAAWSTAAAAQGGLTAGVAAAAGATGPRQGSPAAASMAGAAGLQLPLKASGAGAETILAIGLQKRPHPAAMRVRPWLKGVPLPMERTI